MNLANLRSRIIPGELIVKLRSGTQLAESNIALDYEAKIVERFDFSDTRAAADGGDMIRLKLKDAEQGQAVLKALAQDERVSFAEANREFTLPQPQSGNPQVSQQQQEKKPNDLHEKLWGLDNRGQTGGTPGADVSAKEAWEVTTGDGSAKGPLIAVIDTGIDYTHPDLAANMWTNPGEIPGDGIDNDNNGVIDDVHGYNAYADNGDPMDGHSHGTHCAGTIAAVGNNGQGITGVMQDANLMAIKIFSDNGTTSIDAIVRGVLYGKKMGANLTSNSWGSDSYSKAIFEAFDSYDDALHVMAAGNSGVDNDTHDSFPANYDIENNLSVAALDHNDQKASFSQFGNRSVDVAAPGVDIYSTINGGGYDSYSGTSMATPHVTGGAGLLLSKHPEMTVDELKDRLIYGSDKVAGLSDVSRSDGRVNFAASLEQDEVAPGAPNDLGCRHIKARGCDLTWTSVGDDKWDNGAAQNIEIRVGSSPISEENYDTSSAFTTAGASEVGDLHRWNFEVLPEESERSFHFAMRSVDNVGNRSQMRTTKVTIPAAQSTYAENFDGEVHFEPTGNFQRVEAEGRGHIYSTEVSADKAQPGGTLTSPVIDLSKADGSYLKFESESALTWGESAHVLVSEDGEDWKSLKELNKNREWHTEGIDLRAYDGKKIQLRFSVIGRKGRASKGVKFDNLRILTN